MKRFLRSLPLVMLMLLPMAARADVVKSFQSQVVVSRANVVDVTETILYDPQDGSHHGIYRFVPAQFSDAAGHTYYTKIIFLSVTDAHGKPINIAEQSNDRHQLYLKIGDPNITLDGPQTYVIRYQITPLIVKADGFDRFTLNITGQQWDTAIESASAVVRFDGASAVMEAKCYTGTTGSVSSDCDINKSSREVTVTTSKTLPVNQGLTVDVALPSGSASAYLEPDKKPPLTSEDKAALAISAVAVIVALVAGGREFWFWWADRRERKAQTIIPLYEPPDVLSALQMSILESPRADTADVTAVLIALAVRGVLKIEQTSPKKWYAQARYQLTILNRPADLKPYETALLDAMFGSSQTVDLSTLKTDRSKSISIQSAIRSMRHTVGNELKQKGYYRTSPTYFIWVIRLGSILASIVTAAILTGVVLDGDSYSFAFAFIGITLGLVGFALTFVRTDRTLLGNQEWAKVEGFKWFLKVTETDRLAFTDAPDKTPELFSKMLPYAVALKVEKQWAKQFEGIDVSPAVGVWYVGGIGNFNSTAFASDLSSSFGGAVSSNFAGAGGAGGAGGGGGGGGGGGW